MMETPLHTSDLDYLRSINVRGDYALRLEICIASGLNADNIIRYHCDELGHCKYDGINDSRLRQNRGVSIDPKHPFESKKTSKDHMYELGFYAPHVQGIKRVRELVYEVSLREAVLFAKERGCTSSQEIISYMMQHHIEIFRVLEESGDVIYIDEILLTVDSSSNVDEKTLSPELKTFEDWINYFRSFGEALPTLLRNTGFIEVTQGCDSPCLSVCAVPTMGKVSGHIPYEVIKWLFDNYPEELKLSKPALYNGSDIKYYRSLFEGEEKNGADVLKMAEECYGKPSYFSISYGTDEETISFVYDAVVRKDMKIDRISRLITGRKDSNGEVFFDILDRHAETIGGESLSEQQKKMISKALECGNKNEMNVIIGNAVSKKVDESRISGSLVSCKHGVVLTCNGFKAEAIMPPSKLFPYQQMSFPIRVGDDTKIRFPELFETGRHLNPLNLYAYFIAEPNILEVSTTNGKQLALEKHETYKAYRYVKKIRDMMLKSTERSSEERTKRDMKLLQEGKIKEVQRILTEDLNTVTKEVQEIIDLREETLTDPGSSEQGKVYVLLYDRYLKKVLGSFAKANRAFEKIVSINIGFEKLVEFLDCRISCHDIFESKDWERMRKIAQQMNIESQQEGNISRDLKPWSVRDLVNQI